MNRQLLISLTTVLDMMKDNQKRYANFFEQDKNSTDSFNRGMAQGIKFASYDFEIKRLEYLVNEALKGEGLEFMIEDVNLTGTDFEKEVI